MTTTDGLTTYRIGFFVTVEADGVDAGDAMHRAEVACNFPGNFSPPQATEVQGYYGPTLCKATIIRSQAMMFKEYHDGA